MAIRNCLQACQSAGFARELRYPISASDLPEHLTAKEAVRYRKALNGVISERTLFDRAKANPALKAEAHYVRDELPRAVRAGDFARGN